MKKIVIGGQIEKQEIERLIKKYQTQENQITIKTDLDAALDLKSGQVDYYFGACNTGGGGALAMVIALVGSEKAIALGMPGTTLSESQIIDHINSGKIAFGFTSQDMDFIISTVMNELNKK
ncbi:DUF2620 domain-containing protein [Orbus sturtevantii]|uniref:DUF2620 domain-containing protein n=1 Tax=Orbus sturtevantii TaxID=3074109 RepID=UPI00370D4F6E